MVPVISPKKLIEVALPLDAINVASAREKSIRHGHPSTLHLWWARRPLAAARAVIFAQLVHDPEDLWRCQNPGVEPNTQHKGHWTRARGTLFTIIEELVKWENTTNEKVLEPAREAIRQSWRESCELNKGHPQARELFDPAKMPGLHDPFAGGGTIPLEAQRLGLEAHASDLNPVAVLINKAMIEIPPKFAGRPPVHPDANNALATWAGAAGLAEDVRRYGAWMRDEAFKRIGHLYPPIEVTPAMVAERPDLKPYEGEKLTVIAWLWARTVNSPNPAFSTVAVPLASTFVLSSKPGKEFYVQPVKDNGSYRFTVQAGTPPAEARLGTRTGRAQDFFCWMSNTIIGRDYIRDEGKADRLGLRLMAIVAEGDRGRVYLSPNSNHEVVANEIATSPVVLKARSTFLAGSTPTRAMITGGVCSAYGLTSWGDLFTPRQLLSLTTFSDLVAETRDLIHQDAALVQNNIDDGRLEDGGTGAKAYSEAVSTILAMGIGFASNFWSTLVTPAEGFFRGTFSRQALPMTWDFAEVCPFSDWSGGWMPGIDWARNVIENYCTYPQGKAYQAAAQRQQLSRGKFISTDPPYYDNISYAELADYFYVWHRRALRHTYSDFMSTLTSPKEDELIASAYRHGSKQAADKFFLDGMTEAMRNMAKQSHPAAPVTIYYAFKQSESEGEGTANIGWEAFLNAVLFSGLSITGTWPMRTERAERSISIGTNSLASSIILVCRPRQANAGTISRRQFVRMLDAALPLALDAMTRASEGLHSPVAPVDLSQAIIGPGMAIFSRYDAVLEADGTPMPVKTALQLINRFLAEDDFDADTQFCLHWFEQHAWETADFGTADTLARAKGTSVEGVRQAGVVEAGGGKVRLLKWKEYPADWEPRTDARLPVWEALHQLIRAYNAEGDTGASKVLAGVTAQAEAARQLAYRLYTLCERANRAEDARAYNEVVTGWSGIESAAARLPAARVRQGSLFDGEAG